MSSIWFTSDTHYHHKNIVKGTSSWEIKEETKQRVRNFNTLEEHDQALIKNINKIVKQDDILYHLGDWSFGGIDQILKFRNNLRCRNIHLIYGNHDHHIEHNRLIYVDDSKTINPADLFSSTSYYKEININGQKIVMCHYAMRVWNKSHHGAWMLYGHSHGTLEKALWGKSMDVGIDTHPEFRPYHIDEIRKIMNQREKLLIDHHRENTN